MQSSAASGHLARAQAPPPTSLILGRASRPVLPAAGAASASASAVRWFTPPQRCRRRQQASRLAALQLPPQAGVRLAKAGQLSRPAAAAGPRGKKAFEKNFRSFAGAGMGPPRPPARPRPRGEGRPRGPGAPFPPLVMRRQAWVVPARAGSRRDSNRRERRGGGATGAAGAARAARGYDSRYGEQSEPKQGLNPPPPAAAWRASSRPRPGSRRPGFVLPPRAAAPRLRTPERLAPGVDPAALTPPAAARGAGRGPRAS